MRIFPILFSVLITLSASSQLLVADSLKTSLVSEMEPMKTFELKRKIASAYQVNGELDSAQQFIRGLFEIAAQTKNDSLLARSYMAMALFLDYKSESKEIIEYAIKALKISEKKYPSLLFSIYARLGSAYSDLKNYPTALVYLDKASALKHLNTEEANPNRPNIAYMHFLYALSYVNTKPDSALYHAQLANSELLRHPNVESYKSVSGITGLIYEKLGNYKLAESFYMEGLGASTNSKTYYDAQIASRLSKLYVKQGKLQLAKHYGLKALDAARSSQAKIPFLNTTVGLRDLYQQLNQMDSAYYYATLEIAYRDSLFNQDKINAVNDMTFNEQVRQQEESLKQYKDNTRREHNLQYAAIAIGLITFIILFLALSRSIIVKKGFIEFFAILGLLAVFEFINLFIHPYLSRITGDSPILMLLVLIAIGALLIPLHHKLEKWITKMMVEKNRKIRLEAARKTITNLENSSAETPAGTNET